MKNIFLLIGVIIWTSCASTNSKDIVYKVDGVDHIGHIASGVKKGEKRPGIIIVHEWWGHNEYARERADKLAELGFVAMSIDMYGEGKKAQHPKDAGAFAGKVMSDFPLAKKKFKVALEKLKSRDDVDQDKIVAIGYCFGGGVVLNMARAGLDLDLIASFHGSLTPATKMAKKGIEGKVLVFNGCADPMVKSKHISDFKKEMNRNNVDYKFVNYKDTKHAFTNKKADSYAKEFNLPLAYNEKADRDSWNQFLNALNAL